ncbi:MAG TPA: thiol reductant ABC exporter subunit CydD [Acidocella sp.]|nr:thiol reductant ABC exporter subunit CydD [Acidocella sp.]
MATHNAPLERAESKRLERWLRTGAKPGRAALNAAIGAGALSGLLLVPQSWLLARIVDGALMHKAGLSAAWPLLWGLLALFIARALLGVAGERLAFAAGASANDALRATLQAKLAALGAGFINSQRGGALASLLTDGPEKLEPFTRAYLPQAAVAAFLPAAMLIAVFPADWVSGLIMLLSAPLIPIFMILVGKGAASLNRRQWRRLALLSAHLFDVIAGLPTLKLFTLSRLQGRIVAQMSEDYRHSVMAVLRMAFLSALVLEFFATLSIAMIAVYIGFRLYYGEMNFLPGFFVLLLAPEFYRPLREMGTQYHVRLEAIAAAEQVVALLETPEPQAATGTLPLPRRALRRFALEGVRFGYAPERPVLHGVDLIVERGERVALIGPSGSGKSSIARLLLGLERPQAGLVTLDGMDLREFDREAWFARVAWLPQAPTLFHGSIAANLRLANPQASLAALRGAAALAGADSFIERLPQGYDTIIGEQGQGLSGGQIRRLALARAALKPAELLILDEADASLDAASAALVAAGVKELARERAVLFIAHRLDSVADADRIVVLEEGMVRETGTPAGLRAQGGAYAAAQAAYEGAP